VKGLVFAVFAAMVFASGGLPKGFSQSGKTDVSTQQITQLVFPGVEPISAWQCPSAHIIKGNFTPSSGERCIYHVPAGEFYQRQNQRNAMSAIKTPSPMVADSPNVKYQPHNLPLN
jgi:hypothetical protein